MRPTVWCAATCGLFLAALAIGPVAAQNASATPPDFSGVYYPYNPGRAGGAGRAGSPPAAAPAGAQRGNPPRPTQSAPLSDGSQGRSADAPKLTPEYLAKWELMRKSRISGSYEYDNNARCLPPGMPAMMGMAYGMEIMQTMNSATDVTISVERNGQSTQISINNAQVAAEAAAAAALPEAIPVNEIPDESGGDPAE